MKSPSPFEWRRRVAIRDVDAWGVVWHGNYLGYCDEARAELLRAFDIAPGTFAERGYIAPVVETQTRHYEPARFDEEIIVHTKITEFKGSSLRFEFEIRRAVDNKKLTLVKTRQVLVTNEGSLIYFAPDDLQLSIQKILEAQKSQEERKSGK